MGYQDVISGLFGTARIDQGVDYIPLTDPTPVKAIGDCIIVYSNPHTGWPGGGFIKYQLTGDGEAKGQYVYVAENLSDLPMVGAKYNAGDVICNAHPAWPYTEWGWAQPGNNDAPWDPHVTVNTAGGIMFARWLKSIGSPTVPIPGGDSGPHVPGGASVTAVVGGGDGSNVGAGPAAGAGPDQSGALLYAGQFQKDELQDPSDPRDNLPFSPDFMTWGYGFTGNPAAGVNLATQPTPGVSAFQAVSQLGVNISGLIRGGIAELYTVPNAIGPLFRPHGNFKCYFMMNPESISVSTAIEQGANAPTPPALNSPSTDNSTYMMDSQTVIWTVVFNRMYEVWRGDVHWGGPTNNPNVGGILPGPSDIGCRWDIRALERLCGLLDAANYYKTPAGTTGQGAAGVGPGFGGSLPVQVVFGGVNAYRFTGRIASLEYSYDLFSKDMIPVQATAQIGVVRIYNPTDTSQDLLQSLQQTIAANGQPMVPNMTGGFNAFQNRANYSDTVAQALTTAGAFYQNPLFNQNPNLPAAMDKAQARGQDAKIVGIPGMPS